MKGWLRDGTIELSNSRGTRITMTLVDTTKAMATYRGGEYWHDAVL